MKAEKKFDLACLGILVLDVFGKPVEAFPAKGTSGYFDTLEIHPGGCAFNTGVSAARLGLDVSIIGKTGTDSFGDILLQFMKNEKVDVSGVCRSEQTNTAFSFIMVPEDGQRRIYHTFGVNAGFGPEDVSKKIIKNSRIFHVAGASLLPALDGPPTVELLRYAKANGVITSLDPAVRKGIADIILPCLPHLDIFLPNNDESLYITGTSDPEKQLLLYLEKGVKIAGIKMGKDGILISDGEECFHMASYDVPVADTCGAGDAFIAGFLYGRLQGWNLKKVAGFATATAAFCVQSLGTTTGMPAAENVLEFIAKNKELEITEM